MVDFSDRREMMLVYRRLLFKSTETASVGDCVNDDIAQSQKDDGHVQNWINLSIFIFLEDISGADPLEKRSI